MSSRKCWLELSVGTLLGSMGTKMWRTRVRSLLLNFILFGLGVMTCLICLQITSTSSGRSFDTGSSSFVLSHNPQQEFLQQQSLQLLQQEYSKQPCDSTTNNNRPSNSGGTNSNSNSKITNSNSYTYDDNLQLVAEGKANAPHKAYRSVERENTENNLLINTNSNTDNSDLFKTTVVSRRKSSAEDNVIVYIVTPTYYRPEQKPELTRVAQALLPVSHFIHWIVIDDVSQGTEASLRDLKIFLEKFPLTYTLLKSLPPKAHTRIVGKPRGVGGRRAAIEWLRKNAQQGVVYFADDDNTYDSSIFRQMQRTKKVSMWPVGLVTDLGVSSPIVKNGKVVGFYDGWNGLRKFPVDMAGFAINMKLFHSKPKGNMPWVAGYEEDELLRTLDVTMQDIEPLANNCTEILVWHTKAIKNVWPKRPKNLKPPVAANTNLLKLLQSLPQKSLAGPASGQNKSEGFSFLHWVFGGL